MEGRYVAPTGAGYQYYQGGSTAPPFDPVALQTMLKDTMAKQAQDRKTNFLNTPASPNGFSARLIARSIFGDRIPR
jgi:hypothetical protein